MKNILLITLVAISNIFGQETVEYDKVSKDQPKYEVESWTEKIDDYTSYSYRITSSKDFKDVDFFRVYVDEPFEVKDQYANVKFKFDLGKTYVTYEDLKVNSKLDYLYFTFNSKYLPEEGYAELLDKRYKVVVPTCYPIPEINTSTFIIALVILIICLGRFRY